MINASEITLTFSTADAAFNFTLNGKYLDGSSTNSSAAMAAAISQILAQIYPAFKTS